MNVQRLAWAGVRLVTPTTTAYVDLLAAPRGRMHAVLRPGGPAWPAVPRPHTTDAVGVVTHGHDDHYDPEALHDVLGPRGVVVCPPGLADRVAHDGFRPQALAPWESAAIGDLQVTAVPAVDGLGDEQLSYVVEDGTDAVLHAGDTLWHGYWWRMAERWPRLALALLPVNGAVLALPGERASGIEAVLTPEQAVAAAHVLGAGGLCPIHHAVFDRAPYYTETPNVRERLERAATRLDVALVVRAPGEWWRPHADSGTPDAAATAASGAA